MKKIVAVALAVPACLTAGVLLAQQASVVPPPWAYGFAAVAPPAPATPAPAAPAPAAGGGGAPAAAAPPPDPTLRQAAGSTLQFTAAQVNDRFGPADWFPGDHPLPMPDIVAKGRQAANIFACGFCHYPSGQGRPENAGVNGLPYEYFVQTMQDFRDGLRKSADPRKGNTNTMIGFAKAMTDDEIKAAAKYFAAVKRQPDFIKVVESETSPKFRIAAGMFIATEGADAGMEALAGRIVEVPENAAQTEGLRNPRAPFIAYVPVGSLAKGKALVAAAQCGTCHGANLEGLGPVPGIAGRSPTYLARQMFDMQQGFRNGVWTQLMKPVVAKYSVDDMVAVSAYVATLKP